MGQIYPMFAEQELYTTRSYLKEANLTSVQEDNQSKSWRGGRRLGITYDKGAKGAIIKAYKASIHPDRWSQDR